MILKDITVNIFAELAQDIVLLNLIEVPATRTMKQIREQIIEDRNPNDLVEDTRSRLCVYENSSTPTYNPLVERGWVEIDVYVTKEKNKIDRRALLVAERLISLLDNERRKRKGFEPIGAGAGLRLYNRLPNLATDSSDWVKYGLVFSYDHINM